MKLDVFLAERKIAVINRWFQLLTAEYPPETARFLQREKDRFVNPVGHTIFQAITGLFEALLSDKEETAKTATCLDDFLRIKAIQDFLPSQAVGGILYLKKIVEDELAGEIQAAHISPEEIRVFAGRVDRLALQAFDIYLACREKLYEIRVNEVKNRTARLLQKANLLEKV
ncbi:RsbRD N-terminal domain-containing protein [Moorella naiadis]|uniref:RsbRD N-terminal domain-containing protein n=1 Tax=Moorella naiadis (nom. illeg.) TaxID=3093670 RepID=UPI003D9C91BE